MQQDEPSGSGNSAVPAILIAFGVVLLASSLGLVGWNDWNVLWPLWPLALIAVGTSLLLGKQYRPVVWGGTIALALVLLAASAWLGWGVVGAVESLVASESISQPLRNARRAEVSLESGISLLHVEAAKSGNRLIEGSVQKSNGERLAQTFRMAGGAAVYRLESHRENFWRPFGGNVTTRREWHLAPTRDLPLRLRVEAGIGEVNLDLTGLELSAFYLSTGISETTVTLPKTGRFDAKVDSGIGPVTVRVPRNMAARIRAGKGIGALEVHGDYGRRGGPYVSPDFEAAPHRVELTVGSGIGEVIVQSF